MSASPVLCPVDFSPASRGALRYASAVAAHLGVGMVVLTVEDPMLTEAMDVATGVQWKPEDTRRELEEFTVHTLAPDEKAVPIAYEVAVGKSASEILRAAQELSCQLIVISTHGLTGMRKLFFGSTTERVLRETTVPVLITPGTDPGLLKVGDARSVLHRILVPVDLSAASPEQLRIAQGLSEMLSVPLIVAHVVEPIRSRLAARLHLPSIETDRRAVAEEGLRDLVAALPGQPEALIAYGDPAEEIA